MTKPQINSKLLKVFGAVAFGVIAAVTGFFLSDLYRDRQESVCQQGFELLNKGVVCGDPHALSKTNYTDLNKEIVEYINTQKSMKNLEEVSLYFRDLHNGPVMGINELENFAPASLLKFPLALIYLRSAEEQPELLAHKLRYVGASEVGLQNFKPSKSAEEGQAYSIEELLKMMTSYSDNASYDTLNQYLLSDDNRRQLYIQGLQELGVIAPQDKLDEVVSTRGYASLFRILYNVTYLNQDLSQKMLGWLTESDFDQGLEAGLPKNVKVAHKFGERFTDTGVKQLHDCGVIYYPDNPYLLCVMTKGNDWDKLSNAVATISKMTYEEVDSRRLR